MIGDNLKDIRTYFGKTQKEVAEILGIKRTTYSGYENNIDNITLKNLNIFCNYFGISLDYICGLSQTKKYEIINKEIDINVVARNLKEIRLKHNDSQEKITNIINLDRSAYTRYESAENLIKLQYLVNFAKHYKVSIDWLCGKTKNSQI